MNHHGSSSQITFSESTTLNENNSYSNNNRSSPIKNSFLKVPLSDDYIDGLLVISNPEKLYELKKLAEECPTQWTPKSLVNSLEKLCDTSYYNHTSSDTANMLELHLRTFVAVLEAFIQNPVILNHKLREKLYSHLKDFNEVHHNITVAMEQGLDKTWKKGLQRFNSDINPQVGGVKRNYNVDYLLIHLRDTLHSLCDDETKFREGWRRFKDFFKGVLGVVPAAIPHAPADNANILTTWKKMREAFGFKVPVSNWYKDWRLLLILKQTLDASYQKEGNQTLKKFGERMLLEYLWFHIKQITSNIQTKDESDYEFSKVFNNKKRLFAELVEIEPLSYSHTFWFGILDLAESVCESSTRSITLSLTYYLALESLHHAPSTFIRFKAIEILLGLEHRRKDWFAVVDADLEECANRLNKSKFYSLVDYVKYKLVSKGKISSKSFPNLDDDFPAYNSGHQASSSILSLLAREMLCPVMLQMTDQYYALNCGHFISKAAFNTYKNYQSRKGKQLTCSICRSVIDEASLTLLPQNSTLDALSDRFIAAGLLSHGNISEYDISNISNPDTIMTDIKKPLKVLSDGTISQLTDFTNPPDPVQCAKECFQQNPQNPQKALLILDKTLQNNGNAGPILLERAKIYDHLQRYGEALLDLDNSLRDENDNIEAYQLRAHINFKLKKYRDGLDDIIVFINRIESYKTVDENYKFTSSDLAAYELRGNICMKLGSFYNEAISDFCIVLQNAQNDEFSISSLSSRGALYRELRKYKEALEDLSKVIEYNPTCSFALAQRGSVYNKLNRYSEALDDLNAVLTCATASDEDKLFARAERGDIFCKTNKFYEASCDLDFVLEQDPRNVFAISRRGYIFYMLKKWDLSLKTLNEALTLDKTNYYSYSIRGMVFKQLKNYGDSLADFNLVLGCYPDNRITLYQRAVVFFITKKYDESLSDFDRFINLEMNEKAYNTTSQPSLIFTNALCYRADILREFTKFTESLQTCNTVLQFDSTNLVALRMKGMVLRKIGHNNKALIELDKVLLKEPENLIALSERAAIYTTLHQYQKALADCEVILYLRPEFESISSFQERTKIYSELSEAIGVEEILIHLGRVLQDSPKNSFALTIRAYIYLLQWDCQKAIHDLNCALKYNPNYILGLYQRSVIYRITQDYGNALEDLERILKMDPGNGFAQTERNEIESMKDFDLNQNRYNSRRSSGSLSNRSSLSMSTSERSNKSKRTNARYQT
ncbi:hypothetical protein C1645_758209 [Glomus cerebriforme]|uniref:Uncharacterized protein n=1 Tax=Glomus cerebriforme TaxID=658196 RepID=A0A397TJR3_9GLOM|nr:hypothetical protein C1645_758209 [Glomus cerebriforme]